MELRTAGGGGGQRGALAFWLGCAAVTAFKLWLVWPDEIVARAYPLDQLRYAQMIEALVGGRWLGDYDHTTLIRGPAYPLWAAAVHATGVPLRLANEGLLAATALLFALALRRLGQPAPLALGVFALLVLQPHSLAANRELLASSFYLPLLLCGVAGVAWALAAPGAGRAAAHAAWAGLALGVLWHTRPETPLVALVPATAAVFELAARRAGGASWRAAAGRAAALAGVSSAGIVALCAAFGAANLHHYGVSVTSGLDLPGFAAAGRALYAIEHAEPRHYVPVPEEVRRRAYAASPALRELAPHLERRGWAHHASCSLGRVCDDLGGGWFIWWLRESAWRAGRMPDARGADAYFARVAEELRAACARGELECRRPLLSYPFHPYPRIWLPELPRSLARVLRRMASAGTRRDWDLDRDAPGTPERVRALFDAVAGRREGLTSNGRLHVVGTATGAGDPIEAIAVGRGVGAAGESPEEPDAPPARARTRQSRFELDVEKWARDLEAMDPVLRLARRSGAQVEIPLPAEGERVARGGVGVAIERLEETGGVDAARRAVRRALWGVHALLVRGLAALGLLSAAVLLAPPWRGRVARPVHGVIVVLLTLVVARVALLAVIDASSFSARSSRYVYPAVSLFGVASLMLLREALARLAAVRRASPRPPAAPRR